MKKEIDINAVIALSNIIDEFELFFFDLNNLLNQYKDKEAALFKLDEIVRNKCFFKKRKLVKFYNEHEKTVKQITNIINFRYFIICINDYDQKMFNELLCYLKSNREYKNTILESLNILKKLNLNFLDFNKFLYMINSKTMHEGMNKFIIDNISNVQNNESINYFEHEFVKKKILK